MNKPLLENSLIALAAIVFGIMAGFFWTYTFNVNDALLEVNGETYATVQSLFNVNVRHAMFFVFFFGGGFFSAIAVIANLRHRKSKPFWCLAAACLIYIFGVILYTSQVNLPLNAITEAWDPTNLPTNWSDIRDQWNQANALRVVTSGAAFVLSIVALLLRASETDNMRNSPATVSTMS